MVWKGYIIFWCIIIKLEYLVRMIKLEMFKSFYIVDNVIIIVVNVIEIKILYF